MEEEEQGLQSVRRQRGITSEEHAKDIPDMEGNFDARMAGAEATVTQSFPQCWRVAKLVENRGAKAQKETERTEGIRGRSKKRCAKKAKDQRVVSGTLDSEQFDIEEDSYTGTECTPNETAGEEEEFYTEDENNAECEMSREVGMQSRIELVCGGSMEGDDKDS